MSLRLPIYLDHHATTPVDPRVLSAMLPYFTEVFGNPGSRSHVFGWTAAEAVEDARAHLARLLGAERRELIFTSGATESNNLAIKGATALYRSRGRHLVTSQIEHPSVLAACERLEREGWAVTRVPVDRRGRVDPDSVADAMRADTVLVSVMLANHEIGTLQPVAEIARRAQAQGVLVHTDATQALGKIPVDVTALQVDLLSCSAHKCYGPKGVGALFVRRRHPALRLTPLLDGGGQERGLRSGTLNVPGIVGFGKAAELAGAELAEESDRLRRLRDRLHRRIVNQTDGVVLNGDETQRLPGNLHLSFDGVNGESILAEVRDVALSSGSACTSAQNQPSHVLRALGLEDALAEASIRFGLGRSTTEEEVDYAADQVVRGLRAVRARRTVPGGSA